MVRRDLGRATVGALAAAFVMACAAGEAAASGEVEVRVLSNRADLVSGGDALVEVVLPAGANARSVRVDAGGRDVTGAFGVRPNGRVQGLVSGLREGPNVVTARLADGAAAQITIDNHPIGGPVFAGPQTQPWVCTTEQNGLGPALDAHCNAPTKVSFVYKSSNPAMTGFQPYDPANPPSDVAQTTTDEGKTVPFVVRLERGVIDRGIYGTAVLADPRQPPEPWAPPTAWNGKLYWSFGGDCKPNHRQPAQSALNERALGKGFAVGASGLTVLGTNCNSVVVAEAVMMIKERIVETLGPIRYTMSDGCSGGSMQQHWLVSDYPGLLDGIQPSCSYPDIWTTLQQAEDCHVLQHYFREVSPHLWGAQSQQDAVTGYASPGTCNSFWDGPAPLSYAQNWLDPDNAPACSLPAEQVYHAQNNRQAARCTLQDYMVSIFGRRAVDGFGNYPYDNVGVQYGLVAVNSGQITPEQFVDMNEKVGGLDIDWNYQAPRSTADAAAVETMHRAGLVTYPREAAKVPIIDLRGTSNYEIHTDFESYSMRARLQKANGHHDNQIIWTSGVPLAGDPGKVQESFELLDRWLARIEADGSDRPLEEKVVRNRPADAVDACWIGGEQVTDQQKCRAAFPYYADPRIAAGGPLADDVIKCTLKPLDRDDYEVEFSDAQWERLHKAFPDGVCDYTRPGVGQQPSVPWMGFADGPGGRPLGPAPVSRPVAAGAPEGTGAPGGSSPTGGPRPTACVATAGFRSVSAVGRGRGVRLEFPRAVSAPATIDVFQVSAGRTILGERRVARFTNRTRAFTWNGRSQTGRRLGDGHYFVRFAVRTPAGRDTRRVTLRRSRGRFSRRPSFYARSTCGLLRSFKLSRPVFGGRRPRELGLSYRLGEAAQVSVVVLRGATTVKRYPTRTRPGNQTFRLRLAQAATRRGDYRVRITVSTTDGRSATSTLTARRL